MTHKRPSILEHFKLSARFWLTDLVGKTHAVPPRHQGMVSDMKNVLAIVIKHNNEYMFISVKPDQEDARPILVDVDDVMEHQLNSLFSYFRKEFDVKPDNVRFSPYTFNLAPLTQVKFYMAMVELPETAFARIQRQFKPVSASRVVLHRDSNIFFEALARDFEEAPAC